MRHAFALTSLVAAVLSACQDRDVPAPRRAPVPVALPVSQPDGCPGGLLCEAAMPVFGVRIPRDCRPTQSGSLVRVCVLEGRDPDLWQRAVEFVQSRYPGATVRSGVLLASPARPAPGTNAALLRMRNLGGSVEVAVIAGDADAPKPSNLR